MHHSWRWWPVVLFFVVISGPSSRGQDRSLSAGSSQHKSVHESPPMSSEAVPLKPRQPPRSQRPRPTNDVTLSPGNRWMTQPLRTGPLQFNTQVATSLTPAPTTANPTGQTSESTYYYQSSGSGKPSPPTLSHYDWETKLVGKLFSKRRYNSHVRPAVSDDEPVEVSVELVLLQINEMIEKDQEIVVSGFIKIKWRDARLTWNPADFGGIDWIVTESTNCWLPDLALINSNDVYAVTRDMRFPLTLNASGDILFVPAGKIFARCELNLRFFPFDYQLCKYRFESWAYASELVRITGLNFTIEPEHYMQNPEWQIPDAFVRTEIVHYESYNFSRVDFFMLLKRKSLFFITYTIFPCLALSVLQLLSHMLPFTEPERINFATTTLIAFSVFHVSIVEQMPHSSDSIPLLAIFVDALMCLIGLSLVECFLMMNWLSRTGLSVPSPRMWYFLVDRWGDYLWLGSSGNYWRKNYIYVYERLNHKLEVERRRRELERQRWASAGYQYKIRRASRAYSSGKRQADLEALLYLVQRTDRHNHETGILPAPPPLIQFTPNCASDDATVGVGNTNAGFANNAHLHGLSGSRNTLCNTTQNYVVTEQQPLLAGSGRRPSSLFGSTTNNLHPGYDSTPSNQHPLLQNQELNIGSSSESLKFIRRHNSLAVFWGNPSATTNSSNTKQQTAVKPKQITAPERRAAGYGSGPVLSSPTDILLKKRSPSASKKHHRHPHNPHSLSRLSPEHRTPRHRQRRSSHTTPINEESSGSGYRSRTSSLLRTALQKVINDDLVDTKSCVISNDQTTIPLLTNSGGSEGNVAETSLINFQSPTPPRNATPSRLSIQHHGLPVPPRSPTQISAPLLSNNSPAVSGSRFSGSVNYNREASPTLQERSVSYGQLPMENFPQQVASNPVAGNLQAPLTNRPSDAGYSALFDYPSGDRRAHSRAEDIRNFTEEISTHITNHELKKECNGIWTTYITVVDRILSLFLCFLSFSLLFYLFYLFPEPPNLSTVRVHRNGKL